MSVTTDKNAKRLRVDLICVGLGCLAIGGMLGVFMGPSFKQWLVSSEFESTRTAGLAKPSLQWLQGEGGDNATGRISVIAEQPVSMNQAIMAMMTIGQAPCKHGRSYGSQFVEPQNLNFDDDFRYPVGTRFVHEIECEGALPNEFALTADTSEDDARAAVEKRLGDATDSIAQRVVTRLTYNDRHQKYQSFKQHLGHVTASAAARCEGPVVVHKIVVGAHPHPTPEQKVFLNGSAMVIGSDIRCASDDGQAMATVEH